MKLTVTDNLNVRVGKASLNAPCYQYLAPGSILEVDGNLYSGDMYDGISTWYKDLAGNYYWSGGVGEFNKINIADNDVYESALSSLINWNVNIPQIPLEWKESKGSGVKIAILDTGIYNLHKDLKNAVSFYSDFTPIKDNIDYDGHGTHVAGIIGGRSNSTTGIIGVAPESELIILKVLYDGKDGSMNNYQAVIDALDKAVSLGADIINMSFSLKTGENSKEDELLRVDILKKKIAELAEKNIIIVAAAGDNEDLDLDIQNNKGIFFPAICNEIISVASISEGYFANYPNYNNNLNIIGPCINYLSTFRPPTLYKELQGCSMTTSFISGIIALLLSSKKNIIQKNTYTKSDILTLLKSHSKELNNLDYNNNFIFNFNIIE